MDNIRADRMGYEAFYIKIDGKLHKIYKFGWYISGVGESYVLCLYYWKPKSKRRKIKRAETLKQMLRNKEFPDLIIPIDSGKWCEYNDRKIKRIIKTLKDYGYIDLDKFRFCE